MKKTRWKSMPKYLCLVLVDAAFGLAVVVTNMIFDNTNYSFLFSCADIYMTIGIPLYLILRGILSRLFLKCVWLPNLIFFAELWLIPPFITGELSDLFMLSGSFILAIVLFVISTLCSLVTGGILKLISLTKSTDR